MIILLRFYAKTEGKGSDVLFEIKSIYNMLYVLKFRLRTAFAGYIRSLHYMNIIILYRRRQHRKWMKAFFFFFSGKIGNIYYRAVNVTCGQYMQGGQISQRGFRHPSVSIEKTGHLVQDLLVQGHFVQEHQICCASTGADAGIGNASKPTYNCNKIIKS